MAGALYRIQAEHAPQLSASYTKTGITNFVQKSQTNFAIEEIKIWLKYTLLKPKLCTKKYYTNESSCFLSKLDYHYSAE